MPVKQKSNYDLEIHDEDACRFQLKQAEFGGLTITVRKSHSDQGAMIYFRDHDAKALRDYLNRKYPID